MLGPDAELQQFVHAGIDQDLVTLIGAIDHWPVLLQMPVCLVAGLVWVVPLRPLIRWMETGHFRR